MCQKSSHGLARVQMRRTVSPERLKSARPWPIRMRGSAWAAQRGDSVGQGAVMTPNVEPFLGNWALKYCINGRKIALELPGKAREPHSAQVWRLDFS